MGLNSCIYEDDIVIWRDSICIPFKTESGKRGYWRKEIPFKEAKTYWCYDGENLYYITRSPWNKRLARANLRGCSKGNLMALIGDKEITVRDCRRIEEYQGDTRGPRIICTNNWSVEFDGKSVLTILAIKTKMSYSDVLRVIQNEGGYVDSAGIIHKGMAENKVVTLD